MHKSAGAPLSKRERCTIQSRSARKGRQNWHLLPVVSILSYDDGFIRGLNRHARPSAGHDVDGRNKPGHDEREDVLTQSTAVIARRRPAVAAPHSPADLL